MGIENPSLEEDGLEIVTFPSPSLAVGGGGRRLQRSEDDDDDSSVMEMLMKREEDEGYDYDATERNINVHHNNENSEVDDDVEKSDVDNTDDDDDDEDDDDDNYDNEEEENDVHHDETVNYHNDENAGEGEGGDIVAIDGQRRLSATSTSSYSSSNNHTEETLESNDVTLHGEEEEEEVVPEEEEEEVSNHGPVAITEIEDSPYYEHGNAEVGEEIFEEFKALLEPVEKEGDLTATTSGMNPTVITIFGEALGRDVFSVRQAIKATEDCYKPSWMDGKINDNNGKNEEWAQQIMGWVPNRQLLVCLCEDRFANASQATLSRILKDLKTVKAAKDIICQWDWQEVYPNLAACNKYTQYNDDADLRRCCLCEIFVARAYSVLTILHRLEEPLPESLSRKIRACLKIMNENCKVSGDKVTRLLKDLEEKKRRAARRQSKIAAAAAAALTIGSGNIQKPSPDVDDGSNSNPTSPSVQGPVPEISVARRNKGADAQEGSSETSSVVTTEVATTSPSENSHVRHGNTEESNGNNNNDKQQQQQQQQFYCS